MEILLRYWNLVALYTQVSIYSATDRVIPTYCQLRDKKRLNCILKWHLNLCASKLTINAYLYTQGIKASHTHTQIAMNLRYISTSFRPVWTRLYSSTANEDGCGEFLQTVNESVSIYINHTCGLVGLRLLPNLIKSLFHEIKSPWHNYTAVNSTWDSLHLTGLFVNIYHTTQTKH